MIFETERLLRLIKQDDAQGIVGYASEPNMGSKQHESLDETLKIMETVLLTKKMVFGIVLKKTGKMVGSTVLVDDPNRLNHQVWMARLRPQRKTQMLQDRGHRCGGTALRQPDSIWSPTATRLTSIPAGRLTSLTSNMKEGLRSANSSTTSVTGLTIRSETGPDFSSHSGVKQQTAVRGHSVGGGFYPVLNQPRSCAEMPDLVSCLMP